MARDSSKHRIREDQVETVPEVATDLEMEEDVKAEAAVAVAVMDTEAEAEVEVEVEVAADTAVVSITKSQTSITSKHSRNHKASKNFVNH